MSKETNTLDGAAKAAFKLLCKIREMESELSDAAMKAEQVERELDRVNTNHHLVGKQQEIDDVPGTPFQVIWTKGNSDSFDAIVHRGVDITQWVESYVANAALNVVDGCNASRKEEAEMQRLAARAERRAELAGA